VGKGNMREPMWMMIIKEIDCHVLGSDKDASFGIIASFPEMD